MQISVEREISLVKPFILSTPLKIQSSLLLTEMLNIGYGPELVPKGTLGPIQLKLEQSRIFF